VLSRATRRPPAPARSGRCVQMARAGDAAAAAAPRAPARATLRSVRARRRGGGSRVAAWIAAATSLAPWPEARAQPTDDGSRVTVEWIAPSPCPDGAVLDAKIARLLAGSAAVGARRLRARAVVTRDPNGPWRVDLSTEGPTTQGHRSVTAETCQVAADVVALILALAVDPGRVARDGAPTAEADASTDAKADSALPEPPAPTAPPAPPGTGAEPPLVPRLRRPPCVIRDSRI
jgi:hypothetical protein